MKCVFCGGKVLKSNSTFSYDADDKFLLVKNVPAEVCTSCGEKTYSPEVTDDLLKFVKEEFHPIRTVEVPIYNFEMRV